MLPQTGINNRTLTSQMNLLDCLFFYAENIFTGSTGHRGFCVMKTLNHLAKIILNESMSTGPVLDTLFWFKLCYMM